MIRRLLTVLMLASLATTVSACGRKGPPEAPPGSNWPHGYPQGAPAPEDPDEILNKSRR